MGTIETTRNPEERNLPPEPELNLLLKNEQLDDPLHRRLFRGLDEFLFPKKQPPLVLTSKPVPVRDIWGFYNYKKNGVQGSTVLHVIALAAIVGLTILGRRVVDQVTKPQQTVTLIAPSEDNIPPLAPSKTVSGGGGGGGDRDKFQAPKGKLPKFDMQPLAPRAVVVRNEHPKLQVDPAVAVPPQVKIAMNNMPNLGDPMSH